MILSTPMHAMRLGIKTLSSKCTASIIEAFQLTSSSSSSSSPSFSSFDSVLVSISVFMVLSTVFHSINSPDNSPFFHSVLVVLALPYWSFPQHIS